MHHRASHVSATTSSSLTANMIHGTDDDDMMSLPTHYNNHGTSNSSGCGGTGSLSSKNVRRLLHRQHPMTTTTKRGSSSSSRNMVRYLAGLGGFSLVAIYVSMSRYILQIQRSPGDGSSSSSSINSIRIGSDYFYYNDWNILFHSSAATPSSGGYSSNGGFRMLAALTTSSSSFSSPMVAKPRSMGFYFLNETSTSFVGTERLDPNMIHLHYMNTNKGKSPNVRLQLSDKDWERQLKIRDGSKDYENTRADTFEDEGRYCEAQYDWQEKSFPTCNLLMEVDIMKFFSHSSSFPVEDGGNGDRMVLKELDKAANGTLTDIQASNKNKNNNSTVDSHDDHDLQRFSWESLRLIAHGYWRDVWKVSNIRPNSTEGELVAMKTMRYTHEYQERNYDRHRRDAVAMERLTSSKFIMDIYAACGNSGLFEFADGGSLTDSIWDNNDESINPWSPQEKLVVAYQVASGIAEVHNSAKEGVAAIAHTDVGPDQFVYVDKLGVYRLNDFNRARFIGWNTRKNETCPFHIGSNPGSFRSPEEYNYEPETEKIDVYSMGNIIYEVLTNLGPFEEFETKIARKMVKAGHKPPFPDSILNSTDPFDKAMIHSIEMCWVRDPKKRASAREVQRYITGELKRLGAQSQ
eukprot:CAMPEP_0113502832 /NCGR_PEP_ID=MMETSP0014_2-20120614/33800_1 /TAXON_ID=2857 /ORGANISM="Nitzschia sp." /LENGTH=632 /DNA_ID=CAMNT_0000397717 /DNA_START=251 /DNA_END=2149 /DNA_ORIENTATION=+ /assembly_acc=CAM_ASM_000159